MALLTGVLRVSEDCVVVEKADGTSVLIVWWRDQTRWDSGSRRIRFQKPDGRVVELGDGQPVGLGGSGGPFAGDGTSEEWTPRDVWVAAIDWEVEPDPVCPADSSWSVGDLNTQDPTRRQ